MKISKKMILRTDELILAGIDRRLAKLVKHYYWALDNNASPEYCHRLNKKMDSLLDLRSMHGKAMMQMRKDLGI